MKKKISILTFVLFLFSGATGLAYETLWIRVLALGVGSTSKSMSLVLSIFFLGLSLGSYYSGKLSEKTTNSLFTYGLIEICLGLVASVILFPLLHLHQLLVFLPLTGAFSWFGIFVKFALVALFLIIPTALMGATLPLLVRALTHFYGSVGKSVSRLYAINTFGAVIGAFLTGYVLLPQLGVVLANCLAAILNIAIGMAALWMSRRDERFLIQNTEILKKSSTPSVVFTVTEKMVLFSSGVCGFVSISSEVVWNKYLNIYFGTNIYGIGLVLALFLFGIATGSFLLSLFIDRIKRKTLLYIQLLCASAVALIVSSSVLNQAPIAALYLQAYTGGYLSLLCAKSLVVTLILILPTVLFGASFPLAIAILACSRRNVGNIAGITYSVNTIGAILGSYSAGIFLIPELGSALTLKFTAVLLLLTALVLLYREFKNASVKIKSTGLVLLLGLLCLQVSALDFRNLIKSAYQQAGYSGSLQTDRDAWLKSKLRFFDKNYEDFRLIIEGETAVISLSHDPQDGEENRKFMRLKTSGLNESVYNLENLEELPKYEALIGLLPYLFARAPKSAFVVGYGGGFTVDFLTSTDLKRVNVAELERGIIDAADFVYKGNNPVTKRQSLNLKVEDARFVLASHLWGQQDIIISQPSHSWLSGAANLFTEDFFSIVKDNLTDRGVFSQWLNLYNMDVPVLKSILKTFYTVFPYGAVFTQNGDSELVLLGAKHPLELNLKKLDLIKESPVLKSKLTQVFNLSSYDLLSMYSLSREEALALTVDSVKNTDVNAYAEVRQSGIFYNGLVGETPQNYLSSIFSGDLSPIVKSANMPEFYSALLDSLNEGDQFDKFPLVLLRYEQLVKNDPKLAARLGDLCLRANRFQSALNYLTRAFERKKTLETFNALLSTLNEMERFTEVVSRVKSNPNLKNKLTECYLAQASLESGNKEKADGTFSKIVKDIPGYSQSCGAFLNKVVGQYYVLKKQPEIAIPFLEAYYKDFPSDVRTLQNMVEGYGMNHDSGNEKQFREYLPSAVEIERRKMQKHADLFRKEGLDGDAAVMAGRAAKLVLLFKTQ